jgi:hypothetical protein
MLAGTDEFRRRQVARKLIAARHRSSSPLLEGQVGGYSRPMPTPAHIVEADS